MAETGKIELLCPRCGVLLELDSGFAGAVCRCSKCGQLLSVRGSVPGQESQAQRPDRPGPVPAPQPPAPPRTKDERRLSRWWLVLLIVLVLAAAVGAWWWL